MGVIVVEIIIIPLSSLAEKYVVRKDSCTLYYSRTPI